jgi:hypothetical protein
VLTATATANNYYGRPGLSEVLGHGTILLEYFVLPKFQCCINCQFSSLPKSGGESWTGNYT